MMEPKLTALLDRLHAQSDAQVAEIDEFCGQREQRGELDWRVFDDDMHRFLLTNL